MNAIMSKLTPSATDMIRADHSRVLGTFHRYDMQAGPQVKQALVSGICLSLEIHAQIEDEIFYPAMREHSELVGQQLIPQHNEMRRLIATLREMDPSDAQFDGTFMELMRDVIHHVADEETIVLPIAENLLGERLSELGAQMIKRRFQLTRPRAGEMARHTARAMPKGTIVAAAGVLLASAYAARRAFRRHSSHR
jgi:hemerythrin superfamily protein